MSATHHTFLLLLFSFRSHISKVLFKALSMTCTNKSLITFDNNCRFCLICTTDKIADYVINCVFQIIYMMQCSSDKKFQLYNNNISQQEFYFSKSGHQVCLEELRKQFLLTWAEVFSRCLLCSAAFLLSRLTRNSLLPPHTNAGLFFKGQSRDETGEP